MSNKIIYKLFIYLAFLSALNLLYYFKLKKTGLYFMAKKHTPKTVYVSKRKTFMRVITFIIALVVIAGLVIVFPFDFLNAAAETAVTESAGEAAENAAVLSADIPVTPEGRGLFTFDNFILMAVGFFGGYIISGIAKRLAEKRKQ
jgi:hypothetical protein